MSFQYLFRFVHDLFGLISQSSMAKYQRLDHFLFYPQIYVSLLRPICIHILAF